MLASPTHFVTADSPPILIVQGINDATVHESQSIQFYNELRTAGVRPSLS